MGLGMQIVYRGFAGSADIEAEAGVQLLRLERFSGLLNSCHLAIELRPNDGERHIYDVRLDLFTASDGLEPMRHCANEDPLVAVREVFDVAEHILQSAYTPSSPSGSPGI
ncbi:Metal ABC transporter ATPase [Paraburkholderia sacchari]